MREADCIVDADGRRAEGWFDDYDGARSAHSVHIMRSDSVKHDDGEDGRSAERRSEGTQRRKRRFSRLLIPSALSAVLTASAGACLHLTGADIALARDLLPVPQGEAQAAYPALGPFHREAVAVGPTDPHAVGNPDGLRRSIDVNGTLLSVSDSHLTAIPPQYGAGLWYGSDSTTDGSFGYFIGHNPGDFRCALTIQVGDPVIVYDSDGKARRYFAQDIFVVPNGSTWGQIEERVAFHGESAILQTCLDDSSGYRITVCY